MEGAAVITGRDIGLNTVRGRLLVVKEIAGFLRVSERWVHVHMADGTFPFRWYPIGERDRAADSADLDDWLKSIVVKAGTVPLPYRAAKKIQQEVSA